MIADLLQYFCNERYLKIDGKPVLLICSPNAIPNAKDYILALRSAVKHTCFQDIFLAGLELYGGIDPRPLGLDCVVEYAPNWISVALIRKSNKIKVYDYEKVLRFMIQKEKPEWYRLRCAFPAWDNTPRRGNAATVFLNNSPELFGIHLEYLKMYTEMELPENMQYIFINAWNEWGEGCHLEPDQRFAFSYLKTLARLFPA